MILIYTAVSFVIWAAALSLVLTLENPVARVCGLAFQLALTYIILCGFYWWGRWSKDTGENAVKLFLRRPFGKETAHPFIWEEKPWIRVFIQALVMGFCGMQNSHMPEGLLQRALIWLLCTVLAFPVTLGKRAKTRKEKAAQYGSWAFTVAGLVLVYFQFKS